VGSPFQEIKHITFSNRKGRLIAFVENSPLCESVLLVKAEFLNMMLSPGHLTGRFPQSVTSLSQMSFISVYSNCLSLPMLLVILQFSG
jgi:hypothetical protein